MCEVEKVPNYFCARSFRRTEKKERCVHVQEKKKERKGKERKERDAISSKVGTTKTQETNT